MKSPNYFIVKPKGGKRYRDTAKLGDYEMTLTNNIERADFINREAEVVVLPENYKGEVKIGDTLIVHHNTFRLMRNQRGVMTNSISHVMQDLFYIEDYYLHIDKQGNIKTNTPYVFLKPITSKDLIEGKKEHQNVGKLVFYNKEIKSKGLELGKTYIFKDYRNYRFNIDGKDYFRMTYDSILAEA